MPPACLTPCAANLAKRLTWRRQRLQRQRRRDAMPAPPHHHARQRRRRLGLTVGPLLWQMTTTRRTQSCLKAPQRCRLGPRQPQMQRVSGDAASLRYQAAVQVHHLPLVVAPQGRRQQWAGMATQRRRQRLPQSALLPCRQRWLPQRCGVQQMLPSRRG